METISIKCHFLFSSKNKKNYLHHGFILGMSNSSDKGSFITPGQEANVDYLGIFFSAYRLNEAILMSSHNIQFIDKVRKNPEIFLNIRFNELSEEFPGESKKSSN